MEQYCKICDTVDSSSHLDDVDQDEVDDSLKRCYMVVVVVVLMFLFLIFEDEDKNV